MFYRNNLYCQPQNDMDCYYKYSKSHISPYNIISKAQNIVYDHLFDVIDKKNNDKINNFKKSFNNRDITFFQHIINNINSINTINQLTKNMNYLSDHGFNTLIRIDITVNHENPKVYALSMEEIYPVNEHNENYYEYIGHVKEFLENNFEYKSYNFVNNIINFEIEINNINLDDNESDDPFCKYNCITKKKFIKKYDSSTFYHNILNNYPKANFLIYDNKRYFKMLNDKINDIFVKNINKKEHLIDYLIYRFIHPLMMYTNYADKYYSAFDLEPDNIEEINNKNISKYFGFYIQDTFESLINTDNEKKIINNIFNDIVEYTIEFLQTSKKFSKKFNQFISDKISNMKIIIGKFNHQLSMDLIPDISLIFFENIFNLENFYIEQKKNIIGINVNDPISIVLYDNYSFEVNAFYNTVLNEIFIPSAIINNYFIDTNNNIETIFGGVGAIIGHELCHSIDNYNINFDKNGNLTNWIDTKDNEIYYDMISKLKSHYNVLKYHKININIELTISENIADICGIKLAFRTLFNKYYSGLSLDEITQNDKNKLKEFFKNWVKILRNKKNYYYDVHSSGIVRVNAPFSHMHEYYKIYDVHSYNKNYIETDDRIDFFDY